MAMSSPASATAPRGVADVADEAGHPPNAQPGTARRVWSLVAALVVLALVIVASVAVGTRAVPVDQVWGALWDRSGSEVGTLVWQSRLPRTVIALIAGAALGVAGALIQAVTRNPLADPGILGVNFGAAFAVALAVGVWGITDPLDYQWFAYGGAFLTTIAVYLIGATGPGAASPMQLTLAGAALGAVLSGIITAMTLADPQGFNAMRAWEAGTLEGRDWTGVGTVGAVVLFGLLLALAMGPALNAVALGDDFAAALGANVMLVRVLSVVAVTALAGGSAALAGPIAFVGLMIPHVARWIVGPDQRWILVHTVVLAPTLLLFSDIVGRVLAQPDEVPVGIVTAFIGAPVLIALVRRKKASTL